MSAVLMMVILGGMGNFAGAVVGAFAFEYVLQESAARHQAWFGMGKHWQLGWACSSCWWRSTAAGLAGSGAKLPAASRRGTADE
jgi:ABC-type branched-subunit amino acid transport system permease subunit